MSKSHEECLEILEQLRWNGIPTCPYCGSQKSSPIKSEHRYHCRNCFLSFSVTAKTVFHKTHLKLDKWFLAIYWIVESPSISIRKLAKKIEVSKNTSALIIKRVKTSINKDDVVFQKIHVYVAKNIQEFIDDEVKTT